ncbi:MAG: fatty acyl-AMP ligase [Elainellaceae cyanobacterium]
MQTTSYDTFVDLACDRAQSVPDQVAYRFLEDGETAETTLTYGALDQRARAIAACLGTVTAMGDRAVLVYPYEAGLDFIAAFLGCLYAGVVPAPTHAARNRRGVLDLSGRLASSGAQLVLTTRSMRPKLQRQLQEAGATAAHPYHQYQWLVAAEIPLAQAAGWQRPALRGDGLAFLQYTSGSTGLPKGVMVTHSGLLYNQRLLQLAFDHSEASVGMGWLPLFHDMGLIGNVLQSLYLGTTCTLMSPLAFVQKPVRWLQAISRCGATTSGGPNFAYDLLCRYVTDEQVQQLDLGRWRVAFTGAEPVRAATLEQFAAKFACAGFRREAFYPCYGMAEATLFISGGKASEPPRVGYVDEVALTAGRVDWSNLPSGQRRPLVGCGHAWLDGEIAIAHPQTRRRCSPNEVGEIWVSGSGRGRGYWEQPEATERTFNARFAGEEGESAGPFLRTGDLGFLHDDELFITGRLNDVLVFWGLNHYPEHLEATTAACHPGLKAGSGAAIAVPLQGRDRLVILQEVERAYRSRLTAESVAEAVRWALFDEHFVDVQAIALLQPGSLPKTSSGKVQRRACRDRYLSGELAVLSEWRSPDVLDIPALMRRYLNPLTHLRRLYFRARLALRGG